MERQTHALYTASQTRELDRIAIHDFNISGTTLMERAGAVAFTELMNAWPDCKKLVVFCGTGNNGGDGFVVARLAREQGLGVSVYLVGDANRIGGDALGAYQRLLGADLDALPFDEGVELDGDVIVDGLLGTGLNAEVSGTILAAIEVINRAKLPVLALDVPSGLDAGTGRVWGTAVKADMTVTFVGDKQGLYTLSGPDHCGRRVFDNLRLPDEVFQQIEPSSSRISYSDLAGLLKPRLKETHKGQCGRVLVVGGHTGMPGSVRMAGEAALRTGSGLVTVATRVEHISVVCSARPELMAYPIRQDRDLSPLLEKADVVALGPGLGDEHWSKQLFSRVMGCSRPMVVDADALRFLEKGEGYRDNWVLTPHPGEAAHLLRRTVEEIQSDRFFAARAISIRFGCVTVLKGNGTIISNGAHTWVCEQGNPGMATAGMGDVLTGIIASLMGQGLSPIDAALLGVCLHAAAADSAARVAGERGLLASDLMPNIRRLVNP